jgi:hypothetical protein
MNIVQQADRIQLEKVSVPFFSDFIGSLMYPDPFKRPEIFEVDAMYTEFLNLWRKSFQFITNKKTRYASRK